MLIHGVDVDAIVARRSERADAREAHGLTDDDLVVVSVANLRANKDYPTMLAAANRLVDDGVPVTFLTVGQGPLQEELHTLKDGLDLDDRFRFLGYQEDPIRVLAAGDVFCLSSRYEGLPIALLEALAMGLPAVVTDVGGMPSVVRDGVEGRLVPAGDPMALAGAIAELADPALRAEFAGHAGTAATTSTSATPSPASKRCTTSSPPVGRSAEQRHRRATRSGTTFTAPPPHDVLPEPQPPASGTTFTAPPPHDVVPEPEPPRFWHHDVRSTATGRGARTGFSVVRGCRSRRRGRRPPG